MDLDPALIRHVLGRRPFRVKCRRLAAIVDERGPLPFAELLACSGWGYDTVRKCLDRMAMVGWLTVDRDATVHLRAPLSAIDEVLA